MRKTRDEKNTQGNDDNGKNVTLQCDNDSITLSLSQLHFNLSLTFK